MAAAVFLTMLYTIITLVKAVRELKKDENKTTLIYPGVHQETK